MRDAKPYGDFIAVDPECPRVRDLAAFLGRPLSDDEARQHRRICERCLLLAVLSSEIVLPENPDGRMRDD